MREWLSDEEREREERNAWKLHLEAWALGLALVAILAAAIVDWL